jgi:peptide/nickel transport system substrate-binding protein
MTEATPRRGGTLTMVLSAEPMGLDPVQLQGVQNWAEAIAVAAIYDPLLYPDAEGRLHAKLAKSLDSPDGGASWTLRLRPGIRFSDGTAFDAEAVRHTWARLADPANRSPVARHAALIERMDVVDAATLGIALAAPTPHFDSAVARYLSTIASPAAGETPVGAGPFVLAEWERGSCMRFRRNPLYWQPGKPLLDEIVVLTGMADAAPKYEAMMSGLAQVALEPLGTNVSKYRTQPDRFALMTTPETGGGVALALNLARPPFDDPRLRQALSLVLDSAEFVGLAGYDDPAMVMTTLDRAGTRWCDPALRLPARDVKRAQRLIDAVAAERGAPLRFTVETFANEGHIREANVVKQIVERHLTGTEVTVSVGTVAELMGKWRSGEFDASNHAVRWSDPALDLPASLAASSPANIMGFRDAEAEAALAALSGPGDERTAIAAHHAVLRRVLAELPVIFLSHKEAFHVVDHLALCNWRLFYSLRPLIEDAWLVS